MSTSILTTFRIASALIVAVAGSILPAAPAFAAPRNDTAINASHKPKHDNAGNAYGRKERNNGETVPSPTAPSSSTTTSAPALAATNVAVAQTTSAMTSAHNPAGNNGFIKVNEENVPDQTPNNDPHVGCSFKVEFYNYDLNPTYRATVQFALHEPTLAGRTMTVNGNLNPFIGQDSAGGGNDLDAVETYRLSFTGAPHAQQGYHVKLTIHADGSRGADVKHKVFWVQPCATPATTPQPQILSTSTTSANASLPAVLPSTGTGNATLIAGLLAATGTYFIARRLRG